MNRGRFVSLVAMVIVASLVVSSTPANAGPIKKMMNRGLRFIEEPEGDPPRLGFASSEEDFAISIEHLIVPGGPGSWVRDAKWDEFVLRVSNTSSEIVTVTSVQVLDPRGLFINAGADPYSVESLSDQMVADYKDVGISVAIFAAPSALVGAAVAGGSVAAMGAAATVAVVAAPVAAVAAPVYFFKRRAKKRNDKENIEEEFNSRQHSRPLMLAGGGSVVMSSFFPIVPSPQLLAVSYSVGTEQRMLQIPLDALAGLHVEGTIVMASAEQEGGM